jgi:MDMPI-like protein
MAAPHPSPFAGDPDARIAVIRGRAPRLGRHRRRARRHGQVRTAGGPGRISGTRGTASLVGRIDAGTAGRTTGGRPGPRLLDVVGYLAVATDLRCPRPAPAPGDRGAHLRRQITLGAPQPLPDQVALDGVEEFLFTCCATTSAWPHVPTAFDCHATEGHSWRLTVDGDGARSTRLPTPGTTPATAADEGLEAAGASVHGTAGELVLFMYDRIPADSLHTDGDAGLIDLLRAWEPEE